MARGTHCLVVAWNYGVRVSQLDQLRRSMKYLCANIARDLSRYRRPSGARGIHYIGRPPTPVDHGPRLDPAVEISVESVVVRDDDDSGEHLSSRTP